MRPDEFSNFSYQRYLATDFLSALFFDKRVALRVDFVTPEISEEMKKKILDCYGDVSVICERGEESVSMPASEIPSDATSVVVPPSPVTECKRFGFSDFVEIMRRLRAPDGCEWDRAQTHESIRINLIEEAYELVEAIDAKSPDMMREECGDVLMQAVFHTLIAEENGEFDFYDMLTELCRKLIDRHTHIFGSNHADDPEQALAFWNEAKKKEKKYRSSSDAMDRVPKNLPSLLYAEKVQKLAKKSGFDWDDVSGAIDKVYEELDELKAAEASERTDEAGDLLFAVVNVLRFFKVEPEIALREASRKFLRRFSAVEERVKKTGKEMKDYSIEELDKFWEEVKKEEKR